MACSISLLLNNGAMSILAKYALSSLLTCFKSRFSISLNPGSTVSSASLFARIMRAMVRCRGTAEKPVSTSFFGFSERW